MMTIKLIWNYCKMVLKMAFDLENKSPLRDLVFSRRSCICLRRSERLVAQIVTNEWLQPLGQLSHVSGSGHLHLFCLTGKQYGLWKLCEVILQLVWRLTIPFSYKFARERNKNDILLCVFCHVCYFCCRFCKHVLRGNGSGHTHPSKEQGLQFNLSL